MSKAQWKKDISDEREKAHNRCINLESKREQLLLLIKQLQNLAYTRDYHVVSITQDEDDQLDYIKPANLVINKELTRAIIDRDQISKDINELRDQIQILSQRMSK